MIYMEHCFYKFADNEEIVEKLIEAGAAVDAVNCADGNSPLFLATEVENYEIVRLLIQKNATVNLANKSGATPLHKSASHGRCMMNLNILLNKIQMIQFRKQFSLVQVLGVLLTY